MPFDSDLPAPPRDTAAGAATPALLYLLPEQANAEAGAERLLSAEIAALRQCGRRVVPVLIGLEGRGEGRGLRPDLVPDALGVSGEAPGSPVALAMRRPVGFAGALRLAIRLRGPAAGEAMALGARVAALARRHGCGAIHAAAIDGGALAGLIGGRLAGLPVSLAAQDGTETPELAAQLGAADLVIAPNRAMASRLSALAPSARIHVVPRGLDAEWFRPGQAAPRNGRLLCLSPLLPQAGLDTLILALGLLPASVRPVVDVIGAGPLLEPLREEALDAGVSDHLRFLGTRDRDWVAAEAPRYLGLVAPGLAHQQVPLSILQAMALELPVLARALPALVEVVPADAGHLIASGDPEALAKGLRWLANMPEEQRRRFGAAGRDRVLHGLTTAERVAALAALWRGGPWPRCGGVALAALGRGGKASP